MSEKEVVIVSGARTAIGAFGGSLKEVTAIKLGSTVIREAMTRTGLRPQTTQGLLDCGPDALKNDPPSELEIKNYVWDNSLKPVQVDEVILGNVLMGGQGQNPGRQASIYAGVPKETPAYTLNKLCGSGFETTISCT